MSDKRGSDALDMLFAGKPETLSVEDVAELLSITRATAYTWLRDGVIPGYKLGTTWRVVRDELKATMLQGANAPRREHRSTEEQDD